MELGDIVENRSIFHLAPIFHLCVPIHPAGWALFHTEVLLAKWAPDVALHLLAWIVFVRHSRILLVVPGVLFHAHNTDMIRRCPRGNLWKMTAWGHPLRAGFLLWVAVGWYPVSTNKLQAQFLNISGEINWLFWSSLLLSSIQDIRIKTGPHKKFYEKLPGPGVMTRSVKAGHLVIFVTAIHIFIIVLYQLWHLYFLHTAIFISSVYHYILGWIVVVRNRCDGLSILPN